MTPVADNVGASDLNVHSPKLFWALILVKPSQPAILNGGARTIV
jgi:hypothetical protein